VKKPSSKTPPLDIMVWFPEIDSPEKMVSEPVERLPLVTGIKKSRTI